MRSLTKNDLKYYYFYFKLGCIDQKCRRCGLQQETKIFYHVFDDDIIARAEGILRRKVKECRFQSGKHAERVHSAAIHCFDPDHHKIGKAIKSWDREELEALAPIKRRSRVAWYYVEACVLRGDRERPVKRTEKMIRSKSFRALSVEEAVEKGRAWLADLKKKLSKREWIYEAWMFYANRHRGAFSLSGTADTNILMRS